MSKHWWQFGICSPKAAGKKHSNKTRKLVASVHLPLPPGPTSSNSWGNTFRPRSMTKQAAGEAPPVLLPFYSFRLPEIPAQLILILVLLVLIRRASLVSIPPRMDDQCPVGPSVGEDCQKGSAADVSAEVHAVCTLSFWQDLETGCTAVAPEAKFCQLDSQYYKGKFGAFFTSYIANGLQRARQKLWQQLLVRVPNATQQEGRRVRGLQWRS